MKKLTKYLLCGLLVMMVSCGEALASERLDEITNKLNDFHFSIKHVDLTENINTIYDKFDEKNEWVLKNLKESFYTRYVYNEINDQIKLKSDEGMDISCYLRGQSYEEYDPELMRFTTKVADSDFCSIYIIIGMREEGDPAGDNEAYIKDITGTVEVVDGDKNTKSQALELVKNMDRQAFIGDLDYINHMLHYKEDASTFFTGDTAKKEFKEIKNLIEQHPEFDFLMSFEETRRGTTLAGVADKELYLMKDGIIYGFMQTECFASTLFFVPNGTKTEDYKSVLLERIKNYVNNDKIKFELTEVLDNPTEDDFEYEDLSDYAYLMMKTTPAEYYKAIGSSVEKEKAKLAPLIASYDNPDYPFNAENPVATKMFKLKINNNEYLIGVIEAPTETIDFGLTESYDTKTGVKIRSLSGNVPLDATLKADLLELANNKKQLLKSKGFDFIKGFDLTLFSDVLNSNISSFEKGTYVYIPIADGFDKKNLKAVFINAKNEIEEYEGKIETINNQKYFVFKTKHFSEYSIVEGIKNPQTGDKIIISFAVAGLSLGLIAFVYFKNRTKKKAE